MIENNKQLEVTKAKLEKLEIQLKDIDNNKSSYSRILISGLESLITELKQEIEAYELKQLTMSNSKKEDYFYINESINFRKIFEDLFNKYEEDLRKEITVDYYRQILDFKNEKFDFCEIETHESELKDDYIIFVFIMKPSEDAFTILYDRVLSEFTKFTVE